MSIYTIKTPQDLDQFKQAHLFLSTRTIEERISNINDLLMNLDDSIFASIFWGAIDTYFQDELLSTFDKFNLVPILSVIQHIFGHLNPSLIIYSIQTDIVLTKADYDALLLRIANNLKEIYLSRLNELNDGLKKYFSYFCIDSFEDLVDILYMNYYYTVFPADVKLDNCE